MKHLVSMLFFYTAFITFGVAQPRLAEAQEVKYTALQAGYYQVTVNGIQVSQHTTERKALEVAANQAILDPVAEVFVIRNYVVRVVSNDPEKVVIFGGGIN